MKKVLAHWGPAVVWSGLIFYLSSIPSLNSGLGLWDFFLRKIAHMVEFGVHAAFLIRALRKTWPLAATWKIIIWGALLSGLYAASDEFHQSFVPGRGPSVGDVMIDLIGVTAAALIFQCRTNKMK